MDLTRRELGTLPAQLLDKAKRHVDGGRYEDALHLLSSMLEVWPAFGDAWYQRGIAFYCLNRFSEAIRDAEHAVRVNEFHFAAYALRGRSYLELERPLVALKNFKKSCEVNPSQVLVRGYIDVLQKQNRRLNHDDSTS
jgi:tetratricopeptide (TPR) repeat protein